MKEMKSSPTQNTCRMDNLKLVELKSPPLINKRGALISCKITRTGMLFSPLGKQNNFPCPPCRVFTSRWHDVCKTTSPWSSENDASHPEVHSYLEMDCTPSPSVEAISLMELRQQTSSTQLPKGRWVKYILLLFKCLFL